MSLIYPCTPQRLEQTIEKRVGDHQPRSFTINSDVMIRDLRPNATDKWRKGIITKVLGLLNYDVTVDGYTRQAHVDHILPCPRTWIDVSNNLPADTLPHIDDDVTPMHIVDCEPCDGSTVAAELVTPSPHRNCRPSKRVIEEMD